MTHRLFRCALCAALLLALAACGGKGASTLSPVATLSPVPPGTPALLAGFPALPADQQLNPLRMTAAVDAIQNGSSFDSRSANTVLNGNELQLPSSTDTVAWGLYLFGGVPGEEISKLQFHLSGFDSGEKVYVALGDYTTGQWSYLPPVTVATGNFNLPGAGGASPLQSPLGNTWIFFATFGGDDVSVQSVDLTYPNRNSVTGHVFDQFGGGLAGVKVTTSYAGVSATTAADGSYTLAGVADGTWPLICTLDGYTFYTQPSYVTLAGADAVAPDIIGDAHGARFEASDIVPNDNLAGAPPVNLESGPLDESVSADDDPRDCFRFTVSTNGSYLLHLRNPAGDMLLPGLEVYDLNFNSLNYGASIYSGEVAVALTVNDAPRDYLCRVSTGGGGGKYQLELDASGYGNIGLAVLSGGVYNCGGTLQVDNAASGISTQYLYDAYLPNVPAFAVYDPSYPLGDITVTPQIADYTFVPATQNLTVMGGGITTMQFAATPPAAMDSFEPNDTTGVAHTLMLPYNSNTNPDPLQLTGIAGGDNYDSYKCTPPAGTALAVALTDPGIMAQFPRYNVYIYDDSFNFISTSAVVPGAIICVPTALCNGNVVYIVVSVQEQKNQVQHYALQVFPVPNPVKFQAAARVNNTDLLPGARFQFFDGSFNRFVPMSADDTGLTPPIYLTAGEKLEVDCYRYGTSHDRQTQLYTLPPSDSVLYFDAPDLGDDALEPNNDTAGLPEQSLPATITATVDSTTDYSDYYKLSPGDGKPFRLAVTGTGDAQVYVAVYDSMNNFAGGGSLKDGDVWYTSNDGMAGQYVEVNPGPGTDKLVHYTLNVSTGDAYKIKGAVKDTGMTGLDAKVFLLETNESAYAYSFVGGSYSFDGRLYPPGNYTLAAFATNYDPPNNTQGVTITNADAVVNFSNLTMVNHDAFEPNDDSVTATSVMLATDYTCAVGAGADFSDYFKIALGTGDRVRVSAKPQDPWLRPSIGLLDQYTTYGVYGVWLPDGTCVLDYTAVEPLTYVFYVYGQAHYTFRIDKLN